MHNLLSQWVCHQLSGLPREENGGEEEDDESSCSFIDKKATTITVHKEFH